MSESLHASQAKPKFYESCSGLLTGSTLCCQGTFVLSWHTCHVLSLHTCHGCASASVAQVVAGLAKSLYRVVLSHHPGRMLLQALLSSPLC